MNQTIEQMVDALIVAVRDENDDLEHCHRLLDEYTLPGIKQALLARFEQLEQENATLKDANQKIRAELTRTDNGVKEHALVQEILTLQEEKAVLEEAWQKERKTKEQLEKKLVAADKQFEIAVISWENDQDAAEAYLAALRAENEAMKKELDGFREVVPDTRPLSHFERKIIAEE